MTRQERACAEPVSIMGPCPAPGDLLLLAGRLDACLPFNGPYAKGPHRQAELPPSYGATAMRPRISLAQLLAVMVPIAVGMAAIASPSAFWEGAIFVLTLILLFTAIVGVIYRKGEDRAFWLGLSLFGWGFFLLSSDISFEFRSSGRAPSRYYWNNAGGQDHPIRALTRSLVDLLPLKRFVPKSVGEKVQVEWGGQGSYYPSSILEIKDNKYKIRYDSDPQGVSDEWIGIEHIKIEDLDRSYRIGDLLFALLFAMAGAIITRRVYASRNASKADERPQPTVT